MHAGIIPHRGWRTRERETDRQWRGRREERQGSVLTDQATSRERSGVGEKRGDKDGEPHSALLRLSAGWDRLASLSPVLYTTQRMFCITASASHTPSWRALKPLSPRYLDSSSCFALWQVHLIFVQATLDASQTQFARAYLRHWIKWHKSGHQPANNDAMLMWDLFCVCVCVCAWKCVLAACWRGTDPGCHGSCLL